MPYLKNRVAHETVTTGTGTLTLGAAVAQYFSLIAADDGEEFDLVIVDADDADVEVGRGTYTHAGTLLSRDTVERSTNGDALVSLSAGTHKVYITPTAKSLDRAALQMEANTITSVDLSCVVNTHHSCTIAGLDANRNAVIPAGSVGDVMRVSAVDGDATFWLLVIGDTGITINGGTAATEATRMNKAGDSVKLIATSTTNWTMWPAPPWPAE